MYFLLCVAIVFLNCCQTANLEGHLGEQTVVSDPIEHAQSEKTASFSSESKMDQIQSHLKGPENCSDGIYMKYLRHHYLENIWAAKKRPKRRLYGREVRARANEAVHFASSLLGRKTLARSGALPVIESPEVQFWLTYYTGRGRKQFLKWLLRAQELEPLVAPILAEQGMPPEMFYLAMIESGLNTRARSRAGAGGLWQFLKSTAKMYGLKVNYWVDERRDPTKSTRAASAFLLDLYRRFDDWHLAMAAYNAGPGRVRYAIRKAKTRDYWELIKTKYLRLETKNYVPKVIAAIFLAKNYKNYGFAINEKDHKWQALERIPMPEPVRLDEIADRLGLSRRLLRNWNPEILRGITPPFGASGKQAYLLRLAKEDSHRAEVLRPKLKPVMVKRIQTHIVARGETLSGIARKYHLSLSRLRAFNKEAKARSLRPKQKLAIPIPARISHLLK